MKIYDLTLVLNSNLEKTLLDKLLAKIKKLVSDADGKIEKTEEWGKRVLAYPLKKQKEGLYYYFELAMEKAKIKDLNQKLQIEEEVLRHLIVRDDR